MDLLILFRVLLRRKWYLICIPTLAIVASVFFTSKIKPVYKSTARLATGFTTDDQIKITDERLNLRDAEVKFNNLLQTMNSELVMSLVSYRLILNEFSKDKIDLPQNELMEAKAIFQQKYDSLELLTSFDPKEAKLLKLLASLGYMNWQLKGNFEISRVKDTDYIIVQYVSQDPVFSSTAVNFLSEEYIRYDNSLRVDRSSQSVQFFENLVTEKKRILDEKTKFLNDFKVTNNVLNSDAESTTKMSQIAEYELRKEQFLSDIQRIKISLESINKRLSKSTTSGGNDLAVVNSNIVRIREKISQLNDEYEKTGSTNQDLANSITDLRYQLQVEISKLSMLEKTPAGGQGDLLDQKEKYELELQIANANLENVTSVIRTLRGSVSGYASKEAAILEFQGEVDKAKEEYLEAKDRFNTEQNKSLLAGSSIRILTKGQPNGYPESSKRYLIVALSGVASFGLCVFIIVFIEYIDVRIKTPQQFRSFVKIHLAGSINNINTKNLNLTELFASSKDREMEVFKHFLRKLRFEIESSKSKILLVTSTKPGEGKTFVILCVSYLLSLLQKKVLIIDTNFKHNSLTQILLKKNPNIRKLEQGFIIKGQIGEGKPHDLNESDFADSIISATAHKGINIIGNNGGNESPSEIFAGRDFDKMIKNLSENYDYIIMEGGSLNEYSDAKELIEYADKVIAVFSAESVLKQVDRESINYLKNLNGKFMGAVLNKVSTKNLSA